jgi:hypothetical protein
VAAVVVRARLSLEERSGPPYLSQLCRKKFASVKTGRRQIFVNCALQTRRKDIAKKRSF